MNSLNKSTEDARIPNAINANKQFPVAPMPESNDGIDQHFYHDMKIPIADLARS